MAVADLTKPRKPSGQGYVPVTVDGEKRPRSHHVWRQFYGQWPVGILDHINHNRMDDRIENLREVTKKENHRNTNIHLD